jgi:hypothetical protein
VQQQQLKLGALLRTKATAKAIITMTMEATAEATAKVLLQEWVSFLI